MSSAFSNALAGLTANAQAINIVSSNLANLSTTGYKEQRVSFQDLVNETLSGLSNTGSITGATVAQSQQSFTQGSLQTTSEPFDAAIEGDGFFVVKGTSGEQLFTRQGNFSVDSAGRLLTSMGQIVQGWNSAGGVLNTNGPVTAIQLPTTLIEAPVATTKFSVTANLNSNAAVGGPNATFSSPFRVFDSQGNSHTLTVSFTETAANTWTYNVTIPSSDLTAGGAPGATTNVGTGSVAFDANGKLITPAAAAGGIAVAIPGLASGAADLAMTWDLYSPEGAPMLTQFNSASANLASSQDGNAPGQLVNMSIGKGGVISAQFSNGSTQSVGQLAVASILNPTTMVQVSGNNFAPTALTANPVIGLPATGARGDVSGGALEGSTVDIATEFTNMMLYQRGYQASSKVITTEDTMIQTTIALIR
ncbi:MAG: flagellar hook protein FlgE [Terriglobia bacterium]